MLEKACSYPQTQRSTLLEKGIIIMQESTWGIFPKSLKLNDRFSLDLWALRSTLQKCKAICNIYYTPQITGLLSENSSCNSEWTVFETYTYDKSKKFP